MNRNNRNKRKSDKRSEGKRQPSSRVRRREKVTNVKNAPVMEGVVSMSRDGSVFVSVSGEANDIFVRPGKTRGALHGDRVEVVVRKEGGPKRHREGDIVNIIERSTKPFVGILHTVGKQAWVLMQSRNMPYDISVPFPEKGSLPIEARKGMKVAAVVDSWDRKDPCPQGHIVDVLGMPGENETEMHAILAQFGLPYRFEKEVENAAEEIPSEIGKRDIEMRRDFRNTLTFTIDPADAKDYDDALSFRKLSNGNYEVGVHIADVSWYVRPGSAVDKEAQSRGTSVYLVDRTVPMLPEKLCNKLCSLRPGEEKLTFSAVFELTPQAQVLNPWLGRTIIKSDYRFAYELAQEIIDAGEGAYSQIIGTGSESGVVPSEIKEAVLTLNSLAAILRKKRFKAGAISFERPEMKVKVDDNGKPIGVEQKISKEANWLIEEFMLLANRYVAEFVATGGKYHGRAQKNAKTFVYRVHDEPNFEKIGKLGTFVDTFGYKFKTPEEGNSVAGALNKLLKAVKGKPEEAAIEMMALRSMAKACYSTDNIGHYGLAFRFYTHFTSPIRRYPDLMVHRLLDRYLSNGESADKNYYTDQCKHASERETVAAEAERESIKYKLVEYMQDKVGMEFDGHVSGLTDWGMYVEIEPEMVEGMVSLRDIRSDFFEFNEEKYQLRGRRTGKIYKLGDKVRIRVKGTSLEQKLLDYELV